MPPENPRNMTTSITMTQSQLPHSSILMTHLIISKICLMETLQVCWLAELSQPQDHLLWELQQHPQTDSSLLVKSNLTDSLRDSTLTSSLSKMKKLLLFIE